MRVLLLEPDRDWLAERSRRGLDHKDEVWDGVLHVAPAPTSQHQLITTRLTEVLGPIARARALVTIYATSILDPRGYDHNYRTPDLIVLDPVHVVPRGTEGPVTLAVEVLSPNDESRDKFGFYAERGVSEVWLVEPTTRAVEVYVLRGTSYFVALPDANGILHAPALALDLTVVPGPKLRVTWAGGSAEL